MSLCRNCKEKVCKYECQTCNCSYCLRCDSYIHSFPMNRTHLRKYIHINSSNYNYRNELPYPQNVPESAQDNEENNVNDYEVEQQQQQQNEFLDNNNPQEENFNENENKNNNEEEREPENVFIYSQSKYDGKFRGDSNDLNSSIEPEIYSKKLSNLGCEIIDTKENFDNKIEDLHECFHVLHENQRKKMSELNEKNLKEINMISCEKDIQIQRLKEILEEQAEIIKQLRGENNGLQKIYEDNQKEIESLNRDKQQLVEENKKAEEMNIIKINEIMKMNEEEKIKLINDYNEELVKIKDKYSRTEELFENTFKEKQKYMNDYIEDTDKEKKELDIMIKSLKMDNMSKNKEREKLRETNEELEKSFADKDTQFKSMKNVVAKGTKK